MGKARPEEEADVYGVWVHEPNHSIQKVSEITGIDPNKLYDWRKRYGWDARLAEDTVEGAILQMRAKSRAAVDRLVSIVEDRESRNQDAINAAKLLLAYTIGLDASRAHDSGGTSVYVDKVLVTEMAGLATADLLKLASGDLDGHIVDAQQQRASKRQLVPRG